VPCTGTFETCQSGQCGGEHLSGPHKIISQPALPNFRRSTYQCISSPWQCVGPTAASFKLT
jgi:hypothetical protein